jgi:hypothetical protein
VSTENEGVDEQKESVNVHIAVAAVKERHRRSADHHIVRRSIPTVSPSGVLIVKPEVPNNTFYKPGDNIIFNLTLTHNQSAITFAPDANLVIKCTSSFLTVVSFLSSNGVAMGGNPTIANGEITFNVQSFTRLASLSATFNVTVKSSIHPLANLYMVCDVVGTSSAASYKVGPVSSSPSLYAVFPKVTLNRVTEPSKSRKYMNISS